MQKDLSRLLRDPNLIPFAKQNLLSRIANQAAALNMPCYIVGGFVRDLLLGYPINDLDIVVEGDAIKLGKSLVEKYGGKLTPHHKFHTAVWRLPSSFILHPSSLDLITARSETYSRPAALPTVTPASIEDDLRRRDFTINAMAIRLDGDHFGELLDPLNGQADLEKKIIRVLHPRSFMDDPTRIFRAVRYEQRYSFHLELSTFDAQPATFSPLSGGRIRHELDLIFKEENSAAMLARLHQLGVFDAFDPCLPKFNAGYANLLKSVPPAEFGVSEDQVTAGYLLWVLDSTAVVVESLSKRLVFSSALTQACKSIIQLKKDLPALKTSKPSAWTFYLEKIPLQAIYVLWLVFRAPALREFLVHWRHVKQNTNGAILKARGIAPGPRYKNLLSQLRQARLDEVIKNEKEEVEFLNTLL
jgi:tRNA nucleotidyltransferase (CCA-adding enzyme)